MMPPWIKRNWFVLVLFILPLLAWPWPELGAYDGILHANIINKIAVMIIFLMNGITLNSEVMFRALKKFKVMAVIQGFCFLIAPLVAFIYIQTIFTPFHFPKEFITGIYILACLPTTIASCAIFTHMAGGDRSASLFNAALSNFIGVIFAPFVLKKLLGFSGTTLEYSPLPIIIELLYLIAIPLFVGQFIGNRYHHVLRDKWKVIPYFSSISKVLLLFIVYSAFCNSVLEAKSAESPWDEILLLIFAMAILHGTYLILSYLIGWITFPHDPTERIAILFTAPQKTIAVGIPLSIALITAAGTTGIGLGFTMLPLLMYNNIQWLAAGTLQSFFPSDHSRSNDLGST
jgi:solute carrier family 10 (sodium/bile acid cotransporter), member 7